VRMDARWKWQSREAKVEVLDGRRGGVSQSRCDGADSEVAAAVLHWTLDLGCVWCECDASACCIERRCVM